MASPPRLALAAAAGVAVGAVLPWLVRRLRAALTPTWKHAFYSSVTDCITTVPEEMTIPIDDHAIVRGHAVFDTATIVGGRLYRLDIHLERLLDSATAAKLPLPYGDSRAENIAALGNIVVKTCVASGKRDAHVRFWLTAGPGNLGVTPKVCKPSFYVLICDSFIPDSWTTEGISEAWVPEDVVPLKPRYLAELKSNNYLLNALTVMEAEARGGTFGILHTADGALRESSVLNVVLVLDGVLCTPDFVQVLRGTTVRRTMQLAEELVRDGMLKAIKQGPLTVSDADRATEIFLTGGDTHLLPVVSLAGRQIGDGKVGPVVRRLIDLLEKDAAEGTTQHHELPFSEASITGMAGRLGAKMAGILPGKKMV